jgi:transcriptional regulator with XRE-family HTH domain
VPQGLKVDGEKIQRIRVMKACLSREDAARMVGITVPGLWRIETKGRTLIGTLRRLADVLGVHPSELMEDPAEYAIAQAAPRDRASVRSGDRARRAASAPSAVATR